MKTCCGSRSRDLLILNPLNAELNPIYHLLTLLGAHHIFHVSGLRVNLSVTWRQRGCNAQLPFLRERTPVAIE